MATRAIIKTGCRAVLVKGAHLKGDRLFDVYLDAHGREEIFESGFIDTDNTHGTGCTLSSAIAAYRARGLEMVEAIAKATQYVHQAIEAGRNVRTGEGHGPLNHFFNPQKMITHDLE